jgi:hypothetical protein
MDGVEIDPEVAAHLQSCAPCRSEAEFRGRVATAVRAMPHVTAPDGLLDQVMSAIRSSPAARRSRRRRALILHTWEIGWIGAACLLAAVLFAWLAPWRSWAGALVPMEPPLRVGAWSMEAARLDARAWGQVLGGAPASLDAVSAAWRWLPWSWVGGVVAFVLGFFLLLSWQGKVKEEWEEAHAC